MQSLYRKNSYINLIFEYGIYLHHQKSTRPVLHNLHLHQWADVFTRKEYIDILLESIRFCQSTKGLQVYAWVLMSNHIHMIVGTNKDSLSDIIRDFKKNTSKKIVEAIKNNPRESRKSWLLWLLKKEDKVWFWEEGYHGEEIFSQDFFDTKLNYIHLIRSVQGW